MLLDNLRKTIKDVIRGCKILLDLFYHQHVYVGDGCVKCKCIEFKRDEGVGKMFLIFSKFSRKGPIDLNATFDQSPDEILVLLRKPRKPRFANEFV